MSLKPLGNLERVLRFLFGVALITWAIAGGPVWAYAGVIFLATASWGQCPACRILP